VTHRLVRTTLAFSPVIFFPSACPCAGSGRQFTSHHDIAVSGSLGTNQLLLVVHPLPLDSGQTMRSLSPSHALPCGLSAHPPSTHPPKHAPSEARAPSTARPSSAHSSARSPLLMEVGLAMRLAAPRRSRHRAATPSHQPRSAAHTRSRGSPATSTERSPRGCSGGAAGP